MSNPATPVRTGGYYLFIDGVLSVFPYAYGVQVVGDFAYVADGAAGLQVLDVSNPANPIRRGAFDTSGHSLGVDIAGNVAYVADGDWGLQVLQLREGLDQPLVFSPPSTVVLTNVMETLSFSISATASAGLPVTFSLVRGPAILDGERLTVTNRGVVTLRADQAGNVQFLPASLERTINVTGVPQSITFNTPATVYLTNPIVTLSATANSGLPVTFSLISGPATLTGNLLTGTNAGTAWIVANQAGSALYAAAEKINQIVFVKAAQQLTWVEPVSKRLPITQAIRLSSTASSGLPVTYRISEGPAFLDGDILTITNLGTVRLIAAQTGDNRFNSASLSRILNLDGPDAAPTVITAMPDGRVLIGGNFTNVVDAIRPRLARLNKDLTLDRTFTPPDFVNSGRFSNVLVQPNGGIILQGRFGGVGYQSGLLRRIHSDGSEDPTFGALEEDLLNNNVKNMAVDGNSRILVLGKFPTGDISGANGFPQFRSFVRLLPDGSRDPVFAANFAARFLGSPLSLVQLRDSRIVLGGIYQNNNYGRIARVLPDGSFDGSFVTEPGFSNTVFGVALNRVNVVAADLQDRILAAGPFNRFGSNIVPGWARLNADGTLDPSFSPTNSGATIVQMDVLRNGHILVRHSTSNLNEHAEDGVFLATLASNVTAFAVEASGTILAGVSTGSRLQRITPLSVPAASQVELGWGVLTVSEASSEVRIPVWRTGPDADPMEVNYRVSGGSALEGTDFVPTNGVLQLAASVHEAFITLPLTAQNTVANDDRTIQVELLSATGTSLVNGRTNCVVTLEDDDVGLTAEVFANQANRFGITDSLVHPSPNRYFSNRVDIHRDALVHFEWGRTSPRGTSNEYFSIIWTGWLVPEAAGTYQLATVADDGTRIWLDNQLVLSNWRDTSPVLTNSAPLNFEAGHPYRLVMHYFEGIGDATCRLLWKPPGQTRWTTIPRRVLRPGGPQLIPPTLEVSWLADPVQQFRLSYMAEPGRPISIQTSANGVDWQFVAEAVSPALGFVNSFSNSPATTFMPAGGLIRAISVDGLAVTNSIPAVNTRAVTRLPGDFANGGLRFESISDTRPTIPDRLLSSAVSTLVSNGITLLPAGTITNIGQTYISQGSFYPWIQLDTLRNLTLLHPASDHQGALHGASLGVPIAQPGRYLIRGAFARANDFRFAGDGVSVAVIRNLDTTNLLFGAEISSDHAVNANLPFIGTGTAPFIVSEPVGRNISSGENVVLRIAAFGGEPLTYQWYHFGNEVEGANGPTLNWSRVSVADAGDYAVEVSNAFGRVLSQTARLTVVESPSIAQSLLPSSLPIGDVTSLSAGVSGNELTYQWRKDGAPLTGQTNSSLPLGPVTLADAGLYSVVATNLAGSVTNGPALLRILSPARFAQPLAPQTILELDQALTLIAQVEGTGPFSFQWRLNRQDIPDAIGAIYTVSKVTLADAGTYTVVVTDETGALTSAPAEVRINTPVRPGNDAFANAVSLNGQGSPVSGSNANATRESGEPVHAAKPGSRSVWYTWTPPQNGRVTFRTLGSAFDTLLGVYTGDSLATLAEVASNEDAPNTSYFTSELTFSTTANTRYVIALAGLGDAGGNYVLGWQFVPSAPVVPRIVTQPESQTVPAGARVELSVIVENAERIEWWFNGQRLGGATGPTLLLPALNRDQVGAYVAAAVGGGRTNLSHEAIVEIGTDPDVRSYDKLEELLIAGGVGGAGGAGGARPAGRARASSTALGVPALLVSPGRPGLQVINNTNSATQQREANHCGVKVTRTRWLPVQATAKGHFVIRALATAVPTVMALYRAGDYLTPAACNVGATLSLAEAKADESFVLVVGSADRTGGSISLDFQLGTPPPQLPTDIPPSIVDRPASMAGEGWSLGT